MVRRSGSGGVEGQGRAGRAYSPCRVLGDEPLNHLDAVVQLGSAPEGARNLQRGTQEHPASVQVFRENHGPLGRPALPDYNSRHAAGAGVAAGGGFPTRPKGGQRLSSPALASEAAWPSVLSDGGSCPRVI